MADSEQELFLCRCRHKAVKDIAKKIGVKKAYLEKLILKNIADTDSIMQRLVEGRTVKKLNPDISPIIRQYLEGNISAEELLRNDDVLDYIAVKIKDHHDRYMDCIRFIYKNITK
ncbi:TVG0380863 [Thermoplasma volcanium GSS1]|uniref:TVG0380863 protein n=1 Tax=Thermoplasma volcanium (strain ATCC 51530 / DSM 4299 / JCM 9571 / NBRC 15438 / GSS1) TaxID=273116 RepID=Q97BR1_THEVO|nr:hypothetical protein [Thermoplasma volcanium]BAB59536.1 TVG0380863 [Thermoplasma volcanium GSS1]